MKRAWPFLKLKVSNDSVNKLLFESPDLKRRQCWFIEQTTHESENGIFREQKKLEIESKIEQLPLGINT